MGMSQLTERREDSKKKSAEREERRKNFAIDDNGNELCTKNVCEYVQQAVDIHREWSVGIWSVSVPVYLPLLFGGLVEKQ